MTQLTLFSSEQETKPDTDNWLFATWDKAIEFALKMFETGKYQVSIIPFTNNQKIVELVNI